MTVLYTVFCETAHDELAYKVKYGLLDFDLIRPIDNQLIISLGRIDFAALASLPVPVGIVIYGLRLDSITPTCLQLISYLFSLSIGTFTVYLINQLTVAFCFWFTDSSAFMAASDQLVQMGARPLNLYPRLIRFGLAYVIPISLCSTMSVMAFSEAFRMRSLVVATACVGLLAGLVRLQWKAGLRRYVGASS